MSPSLLRSAVAVLCRPTASPRFLASGAALRVDEPCKACCEGRMRVEAALEKLTVNMRELEKNVGFLQEHERSFQRKEQFQKRLSYVLIPSAIAFFIFGPEKKGKKPSSEEQSEI